MFAEATERHTRRNLPTGCLIANGDASDSNREIAEQLRQLRESKVAAFAAKIRTALERVALSAWPQNA